MQRYVFEAMGTTIDCLLEVDEGVGAHAAFETAEAEFERLEAMLSRFRPESELSRLNEAGELEVSPELLELTELALDARERTDGRFDPTVHNALVAAGYDRSFELVAGSAPRDGGYSARPGCGGGVTVDRASSAIRLEDGVCLDFGGLGKGYSVDRVCDELAEAGPCLVNAGGDLAARGCPLPGEWSVKLRGADCEYAMCIDEGAIATSGNDARQWTRNGRTCHHIIDPRTGAPSTSDLRRVSVVASRAVDAEVHAKALFLVGAEAAAKEAAELDISAVLVTEDGRTVMAGGLA